jgi:magnesium transporter
MKKACFRTGYNTIAVVQVTATGVQDLQLFVLRACNRHFLIIQLLFQQELLEMGYDDYEVADKVGLPPGSVVHTGAERTEKVTISIMEFHEGQMREYTADSIEDCLPPQVDGALKWVHVNGVHDVDIVQKIGEFYKIHPLVIEDIPSVGQRPKIDAMSSWVYIVMRGYDIDKNTDVISSEQVSLVLGKGFIVSFQESAEDLFEPIRDRARRPGAHMRSKGADYLTYTLMDIIIDRYFVVLERIGDIIEHLEDDLIESGSAKMLPRIYRIKRSLLTFRRHIWPLREVFLKLQRDVPTMVREETHVYIRDLYDHIIRVTDHVETYRESITGMLDIYLSSVSNRMNKVMQVLTIVSTIFIPLSIMTALYGMNWPWFPGMDFPILIAAIMMSVVLLAGFRRMKWI